MKIKETTLNLTLLSYRNKDLLWTIGLFLASAIAPTVFAHTPQNQWITGTLVNATLFLAAYKLAPINALIVAVLPSSIALMQGLLPLPMVLLIPFIIVSNIILILFFGLLKRNLLWGIITSSLTKFLFLYALTLILAEKLSTPLVYMFQWPQLFTALAGGLLFASIIKLSKK